MVCLLQLFFCNALLLLLLLSSEGTIVAENCDVARSCPAELAELESSTNANPFNVPIKNNISQNDDENVSDVTDDEIKEGKNIETPEAPKMASLKRYEERSRDEEDFSLDDNDDDDDFFLEEEEENDEFIEDGIGVDIGVAQRVDGDGIDPSQYDSIMEAIADARDYYYDVVQKDEFYKPVVDLCRNKEELCAYWSVIGECDNNPSFMELKCAPMCETCELLHVETRCPMDPTVGDALYPGDLNRMFERIEADPALAHYQPKVLSRPDFLAGDGPETANYQLGMWLVQFDNITTQEEAVRMNELATQRGYERSADVGEENEDGTFGDDVNAGRTSENAWCEDECYEDPVAQSIMQKIEHITGISVDNQESLQQLRYEVGQFYLTHNDFIPYQLKRPVGPRILTFYLYLNDVEEGGETEFPRLGLSVKPKLGRAILWPSIYDYNPNKNDLRSDHQALPVTKGVKYGVNAWIHQRDYQNTMSECA